MSSIRHIVCPHGPADLFATAEFERRVSIWSLDSRTKVAEFDTNMSFGGRRLALFPGDPSMVVTAAYYDHGISAYDIPSGRVRWHRRDLRKTQYLAALAANSDDPQLGVGFSLGAYLVLDARSGVTTHKHTGGIRQFYTSPDSTSGLQVGAGQARLCSLPDWTVLWRKRLRSFAVLDAALTNKVVAFSEAGGALRCFDHSGRELWNVTPGTGKHFLSVCWDAPTGNCLGIEWCYSPGGPYVLRSFTQQGTPIAEHVLGHLAAAEFLGDGQFVVTSAGQILDTRDHQLIWEFQ